ncbi:MAG: AMP-binding protein [Clostridia bacterium]|nr:AMP-binding protein [Clostridia bacterium]
MSKQIPDQHVERQYLENLKELIAYGAEAYAEKLAFRYRENGSIVDITFRQFAEDVYAFGEYLLDAGYGNGDRIALLGENSYPWVVTYFAVMNIGLVLVPIDKELKSSEIVHLLNDSESALLVHADSKSACVQEMQEIGVKTQNFLCIEKDFADMVQKGKALRESGSNQYDNIVIDREKMSAIIYTSGTTGDPKGVMLCHKNLASNAYHAMSCMIIPETTCAILPLNHTFGAMASIICQLWMGHTIFINNSLKMVLKDIQDAKPGHISVVPLYVESFYKNIWKGIDKQGKTKLVKTMIAISNALRKVGIDLRKKLFKSIIDNFGGNLEMIISGGAPIADKYLKGFDDIGVTIINGYGITECSPIVALNRNNNIRHGTVGNPVPTTQIKIENPDENGEGEIWVKGDIVMLGYYNKPEETAKVMKDGWFNTGDIGKMEDNFLSITGRKKNLIILGNGKNVYPEEIETLISYIDNVTEVVVYQENEMIVAEIYTNAEENVDAVKAQIKEDILAMNQKLASYKQIKKVKFRDCEFVKTTTKKIKRNLIKV